MKFEVNADIDSLNRYPKTSGDIMAFLGFCVECHYLFASVRRKAVRIHLTDHSNKSHKGKDRFSILPISAKDYQDYLRDKGNPAFWTAWNNFKKPKMYRKYIPF